MTKPLGPKDLDCPMWRKPMVKVCHQCPWWQQVRGAHPQTGEVLDRWDCAIALLPLLTIEVAQQARQGGAATESLRNEIVARAGPPRTPQVPATPAPKQLQ